MRLDSHRIETLTGEELIDEGDVHRRGTLDHHHTEPCAVHTEGVEIVDAVALGELVTGETGRGGHSVT